MKKKRFYPIWMHSVSLPCGNNSVIKASCVQKGMEGDTALTPNTKNSPRFIPAVSGLSFERWMKRLEGLDLSWECFWEMRSSPRCGQGPSPCTWNCSPRVVPSVTSQSGICQHPQTEHRLSLWNHILLNSVLLRHQPCKFSCWFISTCSVKNWDFSRWRWGSGSGAFSRQHKHSNINKIKVAPPDTASWRSHVRPKFPFQPSQICCSDKNPFVCRKAEKINSCLAGGGRLSLKDGLSPKDGLVGARAGGSEPQKSQNFVTLLAFFPPLFFSLKRLSSSCGRGKNAKPGFVCTEQDLVRWEN